MALSKEIGQLGFIARIADFLGDTQSDTLSATGTTQGAALALTSTINNITTCTAGANDSVKLPLISAAKSSYVFIRNSTAAIAQIFPGSGDSINALAANAALNLAATTGTILFRVSSTKWISL